MAKLKPDYINWVLTLNATQAQEEFHKLEREGFEPITLTAYISATLLSKFQIGNETVTIFNR